MRFAKCVHCKLCRHTYPFDAGTREVRRFCETSLACCSWYAEFWGRIFRNFFEFLRYLYPFQIHAKFSSFVFFKQCVFVWRHIFTKITVILVIFMLNSDPLEFLRYILPFKRYQLKHLLFFNSVWPKCEAFFADFRLLHIQKVGEWALMKINQFCFLHQKAEMHSFAAKFILDISEE